jgi:hypothetical protein
MSSTFTKNFRIKLAEQFKDLTDVSANETLSDEKKNYLYVVLGKQTPWNTGTEVAPTPSVTDDDINDLHKNGIYAKLVTFDNSALVVPRVNWTSNTVYNTYESESNFYVLNSKDQVFKCLSNVSVGTASTFEPELLLSTTALDEPYLQTEDNYKWKYMYTLSSVQKQKFLDANWMPVTFNRFVREAAVPTSIDIVTITNSGNNYTNGSLQDIIQITGDGTGAILKANVVGGQIQDVIIQNRGQDYTTAVLTFVDIAGGIGSGAQATVSISPHDGHGFDPIYELGASTIMFNVDFDGTEDDNFPITNDYRQIFIVSNPFEYDTEILASQNSHTLYTKVKVSPGIGNFNIDEKVFQGTTFASASFTADVIHFDTVENFLYLNNITGTLIENLAIKGNQSGSIRVATDIITPTLHLYSGKVLYISDKLPIARSSNQLDRIKFIISF